MGVNGGVFSAILGFHLSKNIHVLLCVLCFNVFAFSCGF